MTEHVCNPYPSGTCACGHEFVTPVDSDGNPMEEQ